MENIALFATIIVGVVIALVELVKVSAPAMPKNLVPLIGLVLGLVVAYFAYPFTDLAVAERLWAGAIAGLGATGLYELGFNDRQGKTK